MVGFRNLVGVGIGPVSKKMAVNINLPLLISNHYIIFWFIFLQLTLTYQIKLKQLTEVLKRDHDFLKKMTQPNQVKEQLAQLYRELEETGEAIFFYYYLFFFLY